MWQERLVELLRSVGTTGRDVLVHSSFKALRVPGTPDDVVDALCLAVGGSGTLAVPTHTWGIVNAKQPVFDVLLSPSHVGVITECVRKRPEAVRGLHPTHSVAAIGPRAEYLSAGHELDDTPCGPRSPYWKIAEADGLVVMLGITLEFNTSFHMIEERAGLPIFCEGYIEDLFSIDADGERLHVPSRRHGSSPRNYPAVQQDLVTEGILTVLPWGETSILVLKSKEMTAYTLERLHENPAYLCRGIGA